MIGKTRQFQEIFDPGFGKARGVLRWPPRAGDFTHMRRSPPSDLAPWIDSYWMVNWNLSRSYLQETLPHPNLHLVFEKGKCVVYGTSTEKFSTVLEGNSGVFGVNFGPGGFRPFIKAPVATLLNRVVPARQIFGEEADLLEATFASLAWKADKMIAAANAFFRGRLPKPDARIELVDGIVRLILKDREIKTVDDLAARTKMGKRQLQRIFNEYVGISPKWVIRRYRLHELVDILNSGSQPDWSEVALELGYFDQAHLINDFRSIVGRPPAEYQKLSQRKPYP